MALTLAELARRFGGTVRGNPEARIERVAPLDRAGPRDIAFAAARPYLEQLARTSAGTVILAPDFAGDYAGNALLVENPHLCFARVAALLHPFPDTAPGIDPFACVSPEARVARSAWVGPFAVVEAGAVIGERTFIGPGCSVGRLAVIGDGTRLVAQVVVAKNCVVGNHCVLQPGAVIGGDGFGYAKDGASWVKVPQLGRVVIGNDVDVGANTTVDRGALDDTVIADGVKIDNLVHIAHNVRIGEHTAIAACVGIAGSTVIGKRCTLAGQAGIIDHLTLVDNVHVTAGSLVTSSITQPGTYSSSLKALPVEQWRRNAARLHHLDELARRVRALEAKIEEFSKEQKT